METITLAHGILIDAHEAGGCFRGLGKIRRGDTILRSGARPMFINIRNPWAIQPCNYRLTA